MSDTPQAPESESTTEQTPGSSGAPKANKEARYRVERNEARAERDALAQRVARLQRAEVERLAADSLSHPADVFTMSGNDVADYLTEAGEVDADKVAADVAAILAERPGLRKNAPAFDPTQGTGGGIRQKPEPTMAHLLRS